MSRFPRSYTHHELPRATPDRTVGIYCRRCGREIARFAQASVRSVTMCQICVLKEQGVQNPEEHVLTQYTLSADHNRLPQAIQTDEDLQSGVLMLDPEAELEETGVLPQSGGVVGTVKAIFRAMGFVRPPKEVDREAVDTTPSLAKARGKRRRSLFDE